jgi:hypothetical protein
MLEFKEERRFGDIVLAGAFRSVVQRGTRPNHCQRAQFTGIGWLATRRWQGCHADVVAQRHDRPGQIGIPAGG